MCCCETDVHDTAPIIERANNTSFIGFISSLVSSFSFIEMQIFTNIKREHYISCGQSLCLKTTFLIFVLYPPS